MPVSHIGLTVSHLPTSCSFFLTALSPLGYRYIGQDNSQIGFGIDEADFFICQETPGNEAGAAHVAFSAPSRTAVDAFFTAALKAGGRIHGEPAVRDLVTGYYSAAVLDLDGNSIEVVHRTEQNMRAETPSSRRPEGSRVLSWQKEVAKSIAGESQKQPERQSTTRAVVNNITTTPTVFITQPPLERKPSGEMSAKALIGTLLGAAAGAAVAYAMTKGEAQSAPRPDTAPITTTVYQAIEAPSSQSPAASTTASTRQHYYPPSTSYAPPPASTTSRTSHRTSNTHASSHPRAIEAPPVPAPSTLITTFVPPTEIPRHRPHYPSSSAAPKRTQTDSIVPSPSSHPRSHISRAASASKTSIHDPTPSVAPRSSHLSAREIALPASISGGGAPSTVVAHEAPAPVPGLVGSVLGLGSVAPSDSVSQAGSKRESRTSRSSRRCGSGGREGGEGGSAVSERTVRADGGRESKSKSGASKIRRGSGVGSVSGGSVKRSVVGLLQGM